MNAPSLYLLKINGYHKSLNPTANH